MLEMSGENPKEKKTRRKFEPENKNNAVRLVELEKSIYQRGCYRVRYVGHGADVAWNDTGGTVVHAVYVGSKDTVIYIGHNAPVIWDATGGMAVSYMNQDQKVLEISGGVVFGVVASGTGIGAVIEGGIAMGAESVAATSAALSAPESLGAVSVGTGFASTVLDGNACFSGNGVACAGMVFGSVSLLDGGAGLIGTMGLRAGWIAAETLPDGALFAASVFVSTVGVAGPIADATYDISQLLQGGGNCGS